MRHFSRTQLKQGMRALPLLLVGVFLSYGLFQTILEIKHIHSASQNVADQQRVLGSRTVVNQSLPVRLKIPAINVDTHIQQVGVTPQGEMDVPSNTTDVGWFGLGALPGEKGSAVIAGHFNGEHGETGVFAHLSQLKPGDEIFVENEAGQSLTFIIRENRMYDPGYADEVFSQNDGTYLNLITCDGVWDETKNSYSKRLVVFANIF